MPLRSVGIPVRWRCKSCCVGGIAIVLCCGTTRCDRPVRDGWVVLGVGGFQSCTVIWSGGLLWKCWIDIGFDPRGWDSGSENTMSGRRIIRPRDKDILVACRSERWRKLWSSGRISRQREWMWGARFDGTGYGKSSSIKKISYAAWNSSMRARIASSREG